MDVESEQIIDKMVRRRLQKSSVGAAKDLFLDIVIDENDALHQLVKMIEHLFAEAVSTFHIVTI